MVLLVEGGRLLARGSGHHPHGAGDEQQCEQRIEPRAGAEKAGAPDGIGVGKRCRRVSHWKKSIKSGKYHEAMGFNRYLFAAISLVVAQSRCTLRPRYGPQNPAPANPFVARAGDV
jgi:hypothetical protein